jgi:hypothetical protein
MKAFLLFASLSFASAIMLVPHNGNETRSSVYNAVLPENFTINKNFTNDINTKYRPHLAIVESRKLFDNEDAYEYEDADAAAETVVDENYDDNVNLDNDDIAEGDDGVQNNNGSRRLLRRSKAASAPPAPPPAPAPKAAPPPAPKAAPPPAPKAAPPPAPKAASKSESKSESADASKSKSKSAASSKSKSKSAASSKSISKSDIKLSTTAQSPIVNKYSSVDSKLSKKTKELAKKFEDAFASWVITSEGQEAIKFCQSLGIENKRDIYNGCIEDMRVTKSKSIAKESAIAAEEFLSKEAENPNKRFCVAAGDPHVTNYDGVVFHVQESGIYTVARTPDNVFEIQEKMRKSGADKPGVPSCMSGAVVHYKQMNIEVDVANFAKIRVNGKEMDLPEDLMLTFGGVRILYGKQVIEWKGNKMQPASLKVTTPNGFSVMISGGYCGVLETNVPTSFFGKMQGICGNADGAKNSADFMNPNGEIMNVNYGAKKWEMSGYNGPDSPLSKWQLSWKPRGAECYFTKDCEGGVQTRKVIPAPAPAPAPIPPPVVVASTKSTPSTVVVVGSASSSSSSGSKSSSSSSSHSHHRREHHEVCKPEVLPHTSTKTIEKQVAEISDTTKSKMSELYSKFKKMIDDIKQKQKEEADKDEKVLKDTELKSSESYKSYSFVFKNSEKILEQINVLNISLHKHHSVLAQESEYLARLKKFKPKFLYSLDNIKSHVGGIKNDIHATIVDGEDKKGLLSILDDVKASTDKSATLLAKAFLDHYDKYNKQVSIDTEKYEEELKKLGFMSSNYKSTIKESNTLWKEYSDIIEIAKNLKKNMKWSKEDEKSFDTLMVRIAEAFESQSKKSNAKLSTPNTQCAADVLKAHIDHKRV